MFKSWRRSVCFFGAAILTVAAVGCQTWHPETGLTLPSPYYLDHPPQFIPKSPPFPLPREVESLQKATAAQAVVTPAPAIP